MLKLASSEVFFSLTTLCVTSDTFFALLSPSVNLSSNALFNSSLSYQEMLQMEAGFGVKGTEGVNNNCQVFVFCQGRAEAGKIQPAPLTCWW